MTTATPAQPRCWQVAAGSASRDYSQTFLKFGMAFVGADGAIATMQEVRLGDRVILKAGMSKIVAVGQVVERNGVCCGYMDKPWLRDFDGWDLPAWCYVRWHVPPTAIAVSGLTRATLQEVWVPELLALAGQILAETPALTEVAAEPAPTQPVSDQAILGFLVRRGMRPAAAEELTTALRRIRLLARYYREECDWDDVREHEARSFLILPLLIALGWPEQRLKVELGTTDRGRIDVACFRKPYRRGEGGRANNDDCALIVESKGFRHGLDYAPEQAKAYAEQFPTCGCVVVSNGFCYRAYRRGEDGRFSTEPTAYLNLLNPQDAYPLDPANVRGCFDVLEALIPPT